MSWTDDEIEKAKQEYLIPKTVNENKEWVSSGKYDLIQMISSFYPVNYKEIVNHPLTVEKFTFKQIAKITDNITNIADNYLKKYQNINVNNLPKGDKYTTGEDQQRLAEQGFDREYISLSVSQENFPELHNIGKLLNFDSFTVGLHYQPPGGITPRHTDFFLSTWKELGDENPEILELPYDPILKGPKDYYALRCMVALTDWSPGQMFGFEEDHWTQWKIGDVIAFDWAHAKHYTANASFESRAYLKISGITTDKNHWIFNNINSGKITNI